MDLKLTGKVAVVTGASKGIGAAITQGLAAKGGKAVAVQGNVSKAADVKRIFSMARENFGPVDVLVNNAGVYKFEAVEAITEAEFHRHFGTNVLGVLPIASKHPPAYGSLYSATKGAIDTLSKAHARELAGRNIRVNVVAPGLTETEGSHDSGIIGSDMEKFMVAQTPLGRMGQPDDIVPAVVFLASDASAWLTGERISPSGGLDI